MIKRNFSQQSEHDAVISSVKQIYLEHGKFAWINPDGEKKQPWNGLYIDVIAVENEKDTKAWVIEIETDDSVNENEAMEQWLNYDKTYTTQWHLAVPSNYETEAKRLLQMHNIEHCKVITWVRNQNGNYSFWGLPGLS